MKKLCGVALSLVALVACGGRESVTPTVPSPPPADFVSGGICPPVGLEGDGDRGCLTSVHTEDATLIVYADLDDDLLPVRWHIGYRSDEREFREELHAGNPFSYPRAIAAIDVDADGTDEWLIKNVDLAGHGTNWQRLQIFTVDDDGLRSLEYEGEPLFVNVGGTSRMGEGARCEGGHFFLLRTWALGRQNTTWAYSEREYEIEGSEARLVDRHEGRLHLSDYNDPKLDPYYRLECEGYVYPAPVT